jgi:hypothetical protein
LVYLSLAVFGNFEKDTRLPPLSAPKPLIHRCQNLLKSNISAGNGIAVWAGE